MPADTTIPADAIAGLLVDWTGPIRWHDGDDFVDGAIMPDGLIVFVSPHTRLAESVINDDDSIPVELDCLRPEVQARVGSVLVARGTPIWHILDASRTNALSHQHIAEAVAWSVRSVARGGEVLRGVRGPWEETFDIYGGHRCGSMRKVLVSSDRTDRDLHVGLGVTDRCEADRTALARGFALIIDDGALVLPGGES